MEASSYLGYTPYYCTGMMALRSNEATIKAVSAWNTELVKQPQLNQPVFNRVFYRLKVDMVSLSLRAFPSGDKFFKPDYTFRDEATVVHNNWVSVYMYDRYASYLSHI